MGEVCGESTVIEIIGCTVLVVLWSIVLINLLEYVAISSALMRIARAEAGEDFERHRHEIKWEVKTRTRAILNGLDATMQHVSLLNAVRRITGKSTPASAEEINEITERWQA